MTASQIKRFINGIMLLFTLIALTACDPTPLIVRGYPIEAVTLQSSPLPSSTTDNPIIFVVWTGYAQPVSKPVIIYDGDTTIGALSTGGAIIWETSPGQKLISGRLGFSRWCYGTEETCTYSNEMLLAPQKSFSHPDTSIKLETASNNNYYIKIDDSERGHNTFTAISIEEAQRIKLFSPHNDNFRKFSELHRGVSPE